MNKSISKLSIAVMLAMLLPVSVAATAADIDTDKQYQADQRNPQSRLIEAESEAVSEAAKLDATIIKKGAKDKQLMDKEAQKYYQEAQREESKAQAEMVKEEMKYDREAARADKKADAEIKKKYREVQRESVNESNELERAVKQER